MFFKYMTPEVNMVRATLHSNRSCSTREILEHHKASIQSVAQAVQHKRSKKILIRQGPVDSKRDQQGKPREPALPGRLHPFVWLVWLLLNEDGHFTVCTVAYRPSPSRWTSN